MASIDYSDPRFYRMKRDPLAVFDRPASNLASPNIMLGFLDGIGKNDAPSLRNAIQATENAGNARAQESLSRLAQSERDLAGQAMQQQQAKYAADSNARMQLLQKSNEISDNLLKLRGEYGFDENSPKDKVRLQNLLNQKEQIAKQLEAATNAVMNNPLYQGETLVDPIRDSYSNTASQEQASDSTEQAKVLGNFLNEKMKDLSSKELIILDEEELGNEIQNIFPNLSISADDLIKKIETKRDNFKKKRRQLEEEELWGLKAAKERRDAELSRKGYDNEKLKLAIENYSKDAELQKIAAQSQTQAEFIQNLTPALKVFAQQSGLDNDNLKAVFNLIKGVNNSEIQTPPKKAREGKYAN